MEAVKVGIREFRAGLADFIGASAPVAITRHGQTVGYFIPARGHDEAELAALKRASRSLDDLLARHEVDPEAVVAEFKQARRQGRVR
jgi:antitoxin (DNA-binding transcriptional repressor) of toxin-antitoxin stability system